MDQYNQNKMKETITIIILESRNPNYQLIHKYTVRIYTNIKRQLKPTALSPSTKLQRVLPKFPNSVSMSTKSQSPKSTSKQLGSEIHIQLKFVREKNFIYRCVAGQLFLYSSWASISQKAGYPEILAMIVLFIFMIPFTALLQWLLRHFIRRSCSF